MEGSRFRGGSRAGGGWIRDGRTFVQIVLVVVVMIISIFVQ